MKQITGPLRLANAAPLNTNFSSSVIPVKTIDTAGFTIETTGATTATGQFKVKARNGEGGWVDLSLSPLIILSNADISVPALLTDLSFTEIRLDYTRGTSGDTGTFTVWFQGEGNT